MKRSRRETLVCLLLAAAVWGVFGQTIRFGFLPYDDPDYVCNAPAVLRGLTPDGVVYAFTSRHASGWYPLTTLSLMLDTTLYGTSPSGYHRTNVLLHAAAVMAMFLALRALTGSVWRSALVAALFAVHPLRAESVAWISSRKDVLSGLFFFLTLGAYARYAWGARYARMSNVECRMSNVERGGGQKSEIRSQMENPPRRSGTPPQEGIGEAEGREQRAGIGKKIPSKGGVAAGRGGFLAVWWYAATILFFACGLMSKPTVVPLPFLLLLLDFWPLRRMAPGKVAGCPLSVDRKSEIQNSKSSSCRPKQLNNHQPSTINWRLLLEKLPLFALSAAVAAGTMVAEGAAVMPADYMPAAARIANAVRSFGVYLLQTVYPAGLTPFYPHPGRAISPVETGIALTVIAGMSLAAWRWRKTSPWLPVGWLWYLGMLVPVSGLFMQAGAQAHADRYTYLPHAGLLILAVWSLSGLRGLRPGSRRVLTAGVLMVLAGLTVAGGRQTALWKDSVVLFENALQSGRESVVARSNLGFGLVRQGRHAEALEQFRAAIRLKPDYAEAHNNLGYALADLGRLDEAVESYRTALRYKPDYADALNNLGNALVRQGDAAEAAVQFRRALEVNPDRAEVHNNLANMLVNDGQLEEGIRHYREALRLNPGYAEACANLGLALSSIGKTAEALDCFQEAVRMNPSNPAIRSHLEAMRTERNERLQLIARIREACAAEPDSPVFLNNLAWLLATGSDAETRNGSEAVALAERACELTGHNHPGMLDTLAAAYAEAGRLDEAVKTAEKAAALARTAGDEPQAQKLDARIRLYRQGMPFHQ